MECWEFLTDAWLSSLVGQQLNIEHFDVLEAEGNSSSTLVKVQCKTDTLMLKVTRQVAADALAALVDREALFYQTAWQQLHDFGVGLLDLRGVEIRPDILLARVHAWGLKGKDSLPWLQDCRDGYLLKHGLPDLFRSSVAKITEEKTEALLGTADTRNVMDMLQTLAKPGLYEFAVDMVMQSSPMTIVHMDARQGNAFFEEEKEEEGNSTASHATAEGVKLFDWQNVSRGGGALDLAYTLSGSLSVCDRRAWQEDLLAQYLQEFCQLSGSSYSLDELKDDYRKALIWPLVWAALTCADVEGTVDHCAGPILGGACSAEELAKRSHAREEIPTVAQLRPKLLRVTTEASRLHAWRVCASGAPAWGSGAPPDRLQGLVALNAALLRLAFHSQEGPESHRPLRRGDLTWRPALAALLQRYQASGQHRQGSAKALEQEYAMAYAAGNLLELHGQLQLPVVSLLPVLSLLVEKAVEVSMLPGAGSGDEPFALQELRRQLRPLAEPAAISKLFSTVLGLRATPQESLVVMPLRGYQRHCIAVARHEVNPEEDFLLLFPPAAMLE
eukprot:g31812.t1